VAALIASTIIDKMVTEKVYLGIPMEYVEAYASIAGFVLSRDRKILWAHSVRLHPKLQHVTRSRGWNITRTGKWKWQ
jgi:hypothetical protein